MGEHVHNGEVASNAILFAIEHKSMCYRNPKVTWRSPRQDRLLLGARTTLLLDCTKMWTIRLDERAVHKAAGAQGGIPFN
jgi:hypothetical protein